MKNVLLFGNSPAASIAYYNLTLDSEYRVAAFTVDQEFIKEKTLFNLPVVPFHEVESHFPPEENCMLIFVSFLRMNKLRAQRYEQAKKKGYSLISYISSKAVTYPDISIGENCVIGANTVVHPGVKIGNDVIIRENSIIGHNATVKDHCFISGGVVISSNVTVESYCFLGANSTYKNGIKIGEECIIGAGVTLLQDSLAKEVYMSKPAQKLPFSSDRMKTN